MTKSNHTRTAPSSMNAMTAALFEAGLVDADGKAIDKTETPQARQERLVQLVLDSEIPGKGFARRWKTETLEAKLKEAGIDPESIPNTNQSADAKTEETPVVAAAEVVEDTTATVVTPEVTETAEDNADAQTATETVADGSDEVEADAEPAVTAEATTNSDDLTEAEGVSVGQLFGAATVESKLPYALLVKLGENGPVAQLYTKDLAGGTHHNRKVNYDSLAKGGTIDVEVTRIRKPKDGDSRGRHRINVSQRVMQDRNVREQIVVGTGNTEGSIVTAEVREVKADYVRVTIKGGPADGYNGLLHATEVPGDKRSERDQHIAGYKVGDEITGEVVELKEEKKADILLSLSLVRGTSRGILSLAPASREDSGATVTGTVRQKKPYGFFVVIDEGPAAGRHALVHISQVPGRRPEERDEYLEGVEVGQQVTAEVVKAELKGDGNIELGLSLTASDRRNRAEGFRVLSEDADATYMATVIKKFSDGALCEFSVGDYGTYKGKLPADQCPPNTNRGSRTRVRFDYADGHKVVLTRRGV